MKNHEHKYTIEMADGNMMCSCGVIDYSASESKKSRKKTKRKK